MNGSETHLDETDIKRFLAALPFLREFGFSVVASVSGSVVVEMPYAERFSGPAGVFPASMVGTLGDVAAVSSSLSMLPKGWGVATLDFTIKMTGVARGEKLRVRGRVLQAGKTVSVAAADVFVVSSAAETLCGTVLATTRNFPIKT